MARDEQTKKILDDPEVGGELKAEAVEEPEGTHDAKNAVDGSPADPELVERLQAELEEAKRAQEQMLSQTQRTLADYANLKKRQEKEREELAKYASEMTLMSLLPAIDNLERAVSFATDEDKRNSVVQGVVMTLKQLDERLAEVGLTRLSVAVGDEFDPLEQEAVEAAAGPKNKVVTVLEQGYRLHEKVVRPARVRVGNGEG